MILVNTYLPNMKVVIEEIIVDNTETKKPKFIPQIKPAKTVIGEQGNANTDKTSCISINISSENNWLFSKKLIKNGLNSLFVSNE